VKSKIEISMDQANEFIESLKLLAHMKKDGRVEAAD
jgi:hypothetical protein